MRAGSVTQQSKLVGSQSPRKSDKFHIHIIYFLFGKNAVPAAKFSVNQFQFGPITAPVTPLCLWPFRALHFGRSHGWSRSTCTRHDFCLRLLIWKTRRSPNLTPWKSLSHSYQIHTIENYSSLFFAHRTWMYIWGCFSVPPWVISGRSCKHMLVSLKPVLSLLPWCSGSDVGLSIFTTLHRSFQYQQINACLNSL